MVPNSYVHYILLRMMGKDAGWEEKYEPDTMFSREVREVVKVTDEDNIVIIKVID